MRRYNLGFDKKIKEIQENLIKKGEEFYSKYKKKDIKI